MKLGEKIYILRKKQGLSQEELANALNVSRQSVSNWETGAANPEINKLALLAAKLGTSVDFLLDETQDLADKGQGSRDSEDGTEGSDAEAEAGSEADTSDQERATQANKPKNNNYPDWLDNLPGLLKTGFYRYGWLFGIRLALYGLGFVIFGLIGKTMVGGFSRATASPDFGNFGNTVTITPDNLPREVVKQINDELGIAGGGFAEPGMGFMSIIPNAALIIGIILIIAGLVMAYALKAWGKQQDEK